MSTRKYPGPIPSTMTPRGRQSGRRPYDRIRAIVAAVEAGDVRFEKYAREERTIVHIGEPRPRGVEPRTPGDLIAKALIDCEAPMSSELITTDNTPSSLKAAQTTGTRYLARRGHPELRLSFRQHGEQAVWVLAKRQKRGGS